MRLNKFLAKKGFGSRREVDQYIEAGQVFINGETVSLGYVLKVGDLVSFQGQDSLFEGEGKPTQNIYIAFFKPIGIISSTDSNQGESIYEYLQRNLDQFQGDKSRAEFLFKRTLHHIGRLDKNSRGLMILTNDGDLTQQLTHPKYEHEKEYLVTCKKNLSSSFIEKISAGVTIAREDDYEDLVITKPCLVKQISENQFRIVLTQGYKRQIRKMVQALANDVVDLMRVRVSNIVLKPYLDESLIAAKYLKNLIIVGDLSEGESVEIQY